MTRLTFHALFVNTPSRSRRLTAVLTGVLALAIGVSAPGQEPATPPAQPDTTQQPATTEATPPTPQAAPASTQETQPAQPQQNDAPAAALAAPTPLSLATRGDLTEDQLRQLLVGKDLFLRGGYLGDSVSFNEDGMLNGHTPSGSYTLCGVRIDKVHLGKHKVELIGARYGLHFLGALAYEDPTKAIDRVRITPKKKALHLTIDRESVVKPKKIKEPKQPKGKAAKPGTAPAPNASEVAQSEPPATDNTPTQQKNEGIAAPETESTDKKSGTRTTTSQAHADRSLIDALNRVFATGIDDKMLASMPKFWQLYYQAAEARTDYRPADPAVFRQNSVDQKAKLLTNFEPGSNEYAQANGVAGMALYHVVIEADGKPGEIAVARPIGFGLDENAVDSIQKASFAPATKDGKPVPVLLDLVVQFRIYSKRTAATGTPESPEKAAERKQPGPYTVKEPKDTK